MKTLQRFETSEGRWIFGFPVRAFPGLVANIHLIGDGEHWVLVDCSSGLYGANEDLLAGFAAIGEHFGQQIGLADLDAILITHSHIDHFGGLPFVRQHSQAPIAVHPLDRRVLSNYEERLVIASSRLKSFLEQAGVSGRKINQLIAMYRFAKDVYRSTEVQIALEEGVTLPADLGLSSIEVIHVPGHCPGQVCLRVDDILLTADHVLSKTTPHQAPEIITNNTGLGHFLDSLNKISALDGISLALGGHEEPMPDLASRIREIQTMHEDRLNQILEICREPHSIAEVSQVLFGRVDGYHVLLALEEAGAHIEYLYQRGELEANNFKEIESGACSVIFYRRPI